MVASPFNAVFNLIGEVAKGAHGDRFLRGVLRVSIALGLVRNYHLSVGLGAKGTRLKERLAVPHTLLVNIKASLNVIDGIDHVVKRFPKFVVKNILGVLSHKFL